MHPHRPPRRRHCRPRPLASPLRRGDRASVVVEAALVLPIVVMLVFGMITGGMALGQKNSIENAAREASRFGSTLEVTSSTDDWLDDVAAVAVTSSTGELDPGTPGRYLCVALVGTSNGTDGRKIISGETVSYGSGSCPEMSCPSGSPCVHVALGRDGYLDLVVSSQTLRLDAAAVSTFERN